MGSCWSIFCRPFRRKINSLKRGGGSKYFRTLGDSYTIEFENLVESDEEVSSHSCPRAISEEEMGHLKEQRYAAITDKQTFIDKQQQAELAAQEEKLRLEEEAQCGQQREAARLARERRQQEVQKMNTQVDPGNHGDQNMSASVGLSGNLLRDTSLVQQEVLRSSSIVDEAYRKPVQETFGEGLKTPATDWEEDFVSAHTNDSSDSEFDGFVNPVVDTPSWDANQQGR